MSVRMYLTEEAVGRVVTKHFAATKSNYAHDIHMIDGERVYLERGEYYIQHYGELSMLSASSEFLKHIEWVTATYSAPLGVHMRESGMYKILNAEASVEPYRAGSNKDSYISYQVVITAKTLGAAKILLDKIIAGDIRPTVAIHGVQSGVPTENVQKIVGEQQRVIGELKGDLDHAMKVIAEFNVVYADYQRIVTEQRAVINATREQLTA